MVHATTYHCEHVRLHYLSECTKTGVNTDPGDLQDFIAGQANWEMGTCGVSCGRGASDKVCLYGGQVQRTIYCTMMRGHINADWNNKVGEHTTSNGVMYTLQTDETETKCNVHCDWTGGCQKDFYKCQCGANCQLITKKLVTLARTQERKDSVLQLHSVLDFLKKCVNFKLNG